MLFNVAIENLKSMPTSKRVFSYLLVIGLLASSGNWAFQNKDFYTYLFIFTTIGLLYFRAPINKYTRSILYFLIVLLAQLIFFGGFYFYSALLQLMLFLSGVFVIAAVGVNFVYILQKIMYWCAVTSLILFIPILIDNSFHSFLIHYFPINYTIVHEVYGNDSVTQSIFFLNFPDYVPYTRNSGAFWEPGVYGGFLIMSLLFSIITSNKLFSKFNIVILLAIITTFSTTAYICTFLVILLYISKQIKNVIVGISLFGVLFIGSVFLYNNLDFLGKKINTEISNVSDDAERLGGNSRMASAVLDIAELFEKNFYPVFGRGTNPDTRLSSKVDKDSQRTNGDTDLLVRWGLPFFIFFLYSIWKTYAEMSSVYGKPKYFAYFILLIILFTAFGEPYFKYTFFWGLMVLHIPYTLYLKKNRDEVAVVM